MHRKFSLPVFVMLALSLIMAACAPAATPADAAKAPAAAAPAKVDFNTVKSAADAGGMDALVAAGVTVTKNPGEIGSTMQKVLASRKGGKGRE